jgi:large subunit ribosomal protein L22
MSAYKAREVLDLIRGQDYVRATEILDFSDRGAAVVIGKLLRSAAANAGHNDSLDPEEMFVSACYADEGTTLKRWRPRARGRATRIRKRTCHITVILSRLPEDQIARRRARVAADQAERRARRVAGGRRRRSGAGAEAETPSRKTGAEEKVSAEALEALGEARTLEETTHHAELEAEAGSVLDQELELEHEHEAEAEQDGVAQVESAEAEGSSDAMAVSPADDEPDASSGEGEEN